MTYSIVFDCLFSARHPLIISILRITPSSFCQLIKFNVVDVDAAILSYMICTISQVIGVNFLVGLLRGELLHYFLIFCWHSIEYRRVWVLKSNSIWRVSFLSFYILLGEVIDFAYYIFIKTHEEILNRQNSFHRIWNAYPISIVAST